MRGLAPHPPARDERSLADVTRTLHPPADSCGLPRRSYEWNKYNQTHYDHDNPPPKMVQGYKFNIFYPDMIDRSQCPTYRLEPDPSGAKDTCIIRFHGGAPAHKPHETACNGTARSALDGGARRVRRRGGQQRIRCQWRTAPP